MKKTVAVLLTVFLVFLFIFSARAKTVKITLFVGGVSAVVNGKTYSLDVPVLIDKTCNRTLVPLRFIAESFGAKVSWNAKEKKIGIVLNGKEITLKIGSKTAYVNGAPVQMDCVPRIFFSRTLVPLRFVAEAFRADVRWFPKTRKIEIMLTEGDNGTKNEKANPGTVTLIKKSVKLPGSETKEITFYIVKIDTSDKTIKVLPFLSAGGPLTRESAISFVNRVKPLVAINGGTFDLKTNELTGDVVKSGIPQYIRYDGYEYTETMGIDKNRKPFFVDGTADYSVKIGNTTLPLLSVNGLPKHPYNAKVRLFTNWFEEKIHAEKSEEIAVVRNGKVVKILSELIPKTLSDKEYAMLLGNGAKANIGESAGVKITINGKDYSGSSFVRCGPLLLKNGKAYIDYAKYAYLNRTMKKGARSLIGFRKSGEFYFIYTPDPVRLNYGTLSLALEECRMFDYVISLDGGGSCLLYYKGKFIAKPGRKIPGILAVPQQITP